MGSKAAVVGAFGNPLLDIIIAVNDEEERSFVERYGLNKHDSIEMDTISSGLFEEVMNWHGKVNISPGGCSLNTSRVLQWLQSARPGIVTFFGSVGRDERCNALKKLMVKDGVHTRLDEIIDSTTGHCIVLANGQERTLVANVGAANVYTLKQLSHHESLLSGLSLYYLEGFFLSHSPEVSSYLGVLCQSKGKILAFNLCGSYACSNRDYVSHVCRLYPKINVLFGNAFEFKAFHNTSLKYDLEILPFFEGMNSFSEDEGVQSSVSHASRFVIITDGPRDILCLDMNRKRKMRIPVKEIPVEEIKDTVGAGDSFIAGYLSGVIEGLTNVKCIQQGVIASQMIIKQVGVTLPGQQV
eukprot:TRINITY_DN997_c0_g2_i1.p1 TRINITY_DN997_c0_g2~~TRINITY_DN997_c0_g2_i1.p1  ORF type:complete len:355 (+),score=59.18 TRINITY_DN997_c0_g2_i1:1-1065(+)